MWITKNFTPFSVGGAFVCDREGRKFWVVAIRATFTISEHGQLLRPREQPPVSRAPQFVGEPAKSELLWDSDFPLSKEATDVIVRGEAWAPGARPAASVDVGFQVGALKKLLRVHGERVWVRATGSNALMPGKPKPFVSMPLSYTRAYGGVDPSGNGYWAHNPLGRGHHENNAAKLLDTLLPNIEDPRDPLYSTDQKPKGAAGFGALAAHWQPRIAYAGTYDETWKRDRAPLLPENFDARFFQIAPPDQQVPGFLRGGETFVLQNLTPRGTLRFTLPTLRFYVETLFSDRIEPARDAQLHTLLLEAKEQRLTMVWHTALECHGRDHLLHSSLIKWEGERTWAAPMQTSIA